MINVVFVSQINLPLTARKTIRDQKKHHDEEEDSFSVASSYPFLLYLFLISNFFFCLVLSQYMNRAATSVRSKVTIGVAPTFRSTSRVERRKEVFGNN